MSGYVLDRMPECMSDRMSEYMSGDSVFDRVFFVFYFLLKTTSSCLPGIITFLVVEVVAAFAFV